MSEAGMSEAGLAFLHARDLLLRLRTDHDAAVREFRWPQLDRFNWALDYFDLMAAGNHQAALRFIGPGDADHSLSFHDMHVRSNQVANHLRALGVARGDRVLLLLGNVPALWDTMPGRHEAGRRRDPGHHHADGRRLAGPLHPGPRAARRGGRRAGGQVRGRGGRLHPRRRGRRGGLAHVRRRLRGGPAFTPDGETRATDPLLLYFTSGTTSKPKLVLHSHQSYPVGHLSTLYWIGLLPGDVHLNISSPGWAKHAWSSFFAAVERRCHHPILNQPRFDAAGLLEVLGRARVTTFCAPPTVWRMLVQEDLRRHPVHLREVVAAGEPLNPEVIAQVQAAWGLHIRDGYGQTETTLQIANTPGAAGTPGSMGRPMPGYVVRLVDPDGADAGEGEIALALGPDRPVALMQGYGQEDGTVQPVEGTLYRTGDVAARNPDGTLTYVGRADDVFKSSGYRISPFELESVLIEHEAVAEAAVVPSPDPTRTALPKAFVVLAEGHSPDARTAAAIFAHLRARLAPYKRVKRIEFAELPKTISGKIRRVDLRRLEAGRRQAGTLGEAEFSEDGGG